MNDINNSIKSNRRPRILLADDDAGIVGMLKIMLEESGYDVSTTVENSTLTDLDSFQPDLLLLDIWMSGVDGRDVCKQIKANPKTQDLPIIMVSANNDTESIAREAGADDFLAKPFEMNTLLEKVEKYIK